MRYLLLLFISLILSACTTTKYVEVPVDRVSIEYRDRVSIDTLITSDSIIIKEKGDTVLLEKYKYLYKVKEVRDTVNKTDTVTVVKTVEVEVPQKSKFSTKSLFILILVLGFGIYGITKLSDLIKIWKH